MTEKPKVRESSEGKATVRPKKSENKDTPETNKLIEKPAQSELSDDELALSSWGRLALFCNDAYREFIPRNEKNQREQEFFVPIHKKCVTVLREESSTDWNEIITKNFESSERKTADNFFFYISRRYKDTPGELRQQLSRNLNRFVELAEYAFTDLDNRDLVKLNDFGDVVDYFNKSKERTFLFLSELPSVLDENARNIIQLSKGYQMLLNWGASRFLNDFGLQLQRKFRITRTAIKDEAAQNLVRELGETEANLNNQLEQLKNENEELRNTIDEIRSNSRQEAVYEFAKTLQKQEQPVLDQIFILHQRLKIAEESETGLALSSRDSLSVLIALESLLKAFQSLDICQFPANLNQNIELRGDRVNLGEYDYVEGSGFSDYDDKKIVRCLYPGWRVGKKVVTPARVKEIKE